MSENKSFDELLLPVRNDIDRIDKELLKLFTERMQCAERVAEGQQPTCVKHCFANCLEYGKIEELSKKLSDRNQCLYVIGD